jgi:hypothetical protein
LITIVYIIYLIRAIVHAKNAATKATILDTQLKFKNFLLFIYFLDDLKNYFAFIVLMHDISTRVLIIVLKLLFINKSIT